MIYYTRGLDDQCRPVICPVRLLAITPPDADGFDCVILDDDVRIKERRSELFTRPEDVNLEP